MFKPALSRFLVAVLLSGIGAAPARAAFDISVNFLTDATPSQRLAFTQAETTWESLLSGYQTGAATATITSLVINASITPIDGAGAILGSAGPTAFFNDGVYTLSTAGEMEFDSADVANLEASGRFNAVILHEMGHVMGCGTLWTDNGVYVDDTGQYTGANALATYRTEFNQPLATFIPVELGGGAGTRNGHWAEVNPNTTGIFNAQGQRFSDELMTGYLGSGAYISRTTVEQFRDIGYTPAVVAEPGAAGLFLLGAVGLVRARERRRRR